MRLSRPNPDKSIREGEVTERLKVHDWKSCVLQKSTGGSNPPLSATPDGARDGSRSLALDSVEGYFPKSDVDC
jgi:hypothetical protein